MNKRERADCLRRCYWYKREIRIQIDMSPCDFIKNSLLLLLHLNRRNFRLFVILFLRFAVFDWKNLSHFNKVSRMHLLPFDLTRCLESSVLFWLLLNAYQQFERRFVNEKAVHMKTMHALCVAKWEIFYRLRLNKLFVFV